MSNLDIIRYFAVLEQAYINSLVATAKPDNELDLREINYISAYLNKVGEEIPDEPLCDSYDEG